MEKGEIEEGELGKRGGGGARGPLIGGNIRLSGRGKEDTMRAEGNWIRLITQRGTETGGEKHVHYERGGKDDKGGVH